MSDIEKRHAGRTPLRPRTHRILLEDMDVRADIGFHDFEIGRPQRLLVTIEVTIDIGLWPQTDDRRSSWDYDVMRNEVRALVQSRHFNLQETLAGEIFELLAAKPGVTALSIWLRKPDVYDDAKSVGVLLAGE